MTRVEKAEALFKKGYNCSQAVVGAFSDMINIDNDTLIKLASPFGGGMGRLREVCGAVSSMFMIAGIKKGYTTPNDDAIKEKHYKLIQDLANQFKEKYNTIICRELLETNDNSPIPSKRTEKYYEERPCEEFIKTCAELITQNL